VNKWSVLQPLALNLFISLQPGIDLMAHLGGGIAGGLVMLSGVLARDPHGRAWRPAAHVAGALMASCIAMALARGRPWELRQPALELERLPGAPFTVPVPRGFAMETGGGAVRYGTLPQDPLLVLCTATLAEAPAPAGQPPSHRREAYPNGVSSDVWSFTFGRHALELEVARLPDLPEVWASVPERIARGVVFTGESPAATTPVPSSPAPPASPGAAGPPPSR
jgi:hypothetical protein